MYRDDVVAVTFLEVERLLALEKQAAATAAARLLAELSVAPQANAAPCCLSEAAYFIDDPVPAIRKGWGQADETIMRRRSLWTPSAPSKEFSKRKLTLTICSSRSTLPPLQIKHRIRSIRISSLVSQSPTTLRGFWFTHPRISLN